MSSFERVPIRSAALFLPTLILAAASATVLADDSMVEGFQIRPYYRLVSTG